MSRVQKLNTVTLVNPVTIDGNQVSEITVRKPMGGDLRGLKLTDILQMDMNAMTKLLPRITQPSLSPQQLQTDIEPEDLTDLCSKVVLFFVRREQLDGEVLELQAS